MNRLDAERLSAESLGVVWDFNPDGRLVEWDAVENLLLDILESWTLDEAKRHVRPHISVQDGGDKR